MLRYDRRSHRSYLSDVPRIDDEAAEQVE